MNFLENFHCEFSGVSEGPRLVFLHGLMGYAANFRRIAKPFESTHSILMYDQRGHGRSWKPEAGYRPEDYAQDLLQILDALKWETIDLVGHSMGGRNAMAFAANHPSRVKKLVIEDIGPEANPASVRKIEALLAKIPTPFVDKRKAKEFMLNELGDPALGQYLYSNLIETSPSVFDWQFSKLAILESVRTGRLTDRWDHIEALRCPTLLIRGAKSDEISEETYEKILRTNPKIQGVTIADAGHWVHFDQPLKFIEEIEKFLRS